MKSEIKRKLKRVLKREKEASLLRIGIPQPPTPQNFFKEEMIEFLKLNPNNIGTTTRMKYAKDSCRELENKVIKTIASWFRGKNIDGYVNSGSTEGNIMGLWIGKEYLRKYGKPIIVAHSESHYSIDKASKLLDLKLLKTKKRLWKEPMDKNQLSEIVKDRKSPMIVLATLGHTSTGVIDNLRSITEFINAHNVPCYLHLDASIGAFFVPFLSNSNHLGFDNPNVKSITLDFHKYGFLYYPSGIFLCRKNLQDFIGSKTGYTKIFDDTLIGSRSGILPAIIWANTEYLKKSDFKKRANKVINNKNKFIKRIKSKDIAFVNNKLMPMLCIILKKRLPVSKEKKFRIHAIKRKEGYAYTIYFYPEYLNSYKELLKII